MKVHAFLPDPDNGPTWDGKHLCLCGLPGDHACHEVPERTEEERAVDARRIGEEVE